MTKMGLHLKLVLVVFSIGILNNAKAANFHAADPTSDEVSPQGRPFAEPAVAEQRTKKTTNGAEFKRVSEEQLKAAGIKDTKKFGEAWEEPEFLPNGKRNKNRKIWGDVARDKDGSPMWMNHAQAEKYCEDLGATLPSGYVEKLNIDNVDEDSDFVRLRKFMGAKSKEDWGAAEGYKPQILPSLETYEKGGREFSYLFWSGSMTPHFEDSRFYFRGRDGYVSTEDRGNIDRNTVRCVVSPRN